MVEDNEDDYLLTKEMLNELPTFVFQLEWVSRADAALDLMEQNQHDVYLLDYDLGKHTGLYVLRSAVARGCKGPIIFLTGQVDHDVDMAAMEAGAVHYLVKNQIDGPLLERSLRYAIEQKRVEAEVAEMQQKLVDIREQERLHLARELHDGPLQDLMGIHFHLSALTNLLEMGPALKQAGLIQQNLQAATNSLRSLCVELRSPILASFGLAKAIRAYTKTFQGQQPSLGIELDLDEDNQLLSERVRLALYRIYQHALANVAAHAQASQIKVKFRLRDHRVSIRVEDNGKGFCVPKRWIEFAREGHLGLIGSAERAEAIGGRLEVTSDRESGTVLTVTAPYPQPE